MHYFGQLLWTIISAVVVIFAVSFAISNNAMISLALWPYPDNCNTYMVICVVPL